jgi:hypothetical protein
MKSNVLTLGVLVLILLALPVISLFYSYQGVQLRKSALNELKPLDSLTRPWLDRRPQQTRYYLVFSNFSDTASQAAIIDQFLGEKVSYVFLNDTTFQGNYSNPQTTEWSKKANFHFALDSSYVIPSTAIHLIDDQHRLLHRYDLSNQAEKIKLVEHLAFLITKK